MPPSLCCCDAAVLDDELVLLRSSHAVALVKQDVGLVNSVRAALVKLDSE